MQRASYQFTPYSSHQQWQIVFPYTLHFWIYLLHLFFTFILVVCVCVPARARVCVYNNLPLVTVILTLSIPYTAEFPLGPLLIQVTTSKIHSMMKAVPLSFSSPPPISFSAVFFFITFPLLRNSLQSSLWRRFELEMQGQNSSAHSILRLGQRIVYTELVHSPCCP